MVVVPARQATYAGGIDSFESILALLKSLKIRALESFCLLDMSSTSHFH
jgi:hypothetical protein